MPAFELPGVVHTMLARLRSVAQAQSQRKLTFRAKIAAAGAAIATFVLITATICLGLFYYTTERAQLVEAHTGAAALLAETVSAAIVFDDPIAGSDAVLPYVNTDGIDAVRILRNDGAIFVDESVRQVDWPSSIHGSVVTSSMVYVEAPVFEGGERLGTVLIAANLNAFYAVVQKMLLVLTLLVLAGTVVAGFVSNQLANRIMRPVLRLANAMEDTRKSGDFSKRVVSEANDEFGRLVSRYNDLLEQLANNERDLQQTMGELTSARDEARAGNVAKSQFLANMSHELRTPLNAVIGYSNLLLQDPVALENPGVADDLKRIMRAGTHLLGLINEVLDLSKIEAGKLTLEVSSIDIGDFVKETVQTLGPAAQQNGNTFEHVVALGIAPLEADVTRLRQCLLNLLSNACKFTKDGQVSLQVREEMADDGVHVVFEVRDTGIGLSVEQIGNLFRPFAQADSSVTRKFGGTGLGLAITRNLARLMGGDVTVTSVMGQGSVFKLSIRRAGSRAAPAPQAIETAAPAVSEPRERRLAVVIDDDPDAVELVSRWLVQKDFQVLHSPNGDQGLDLIRQRQPDVVILDLHIDGRSGWSVLEAMRDDPTLSDIPAIVVSLDDDHKRTMQLGAHDHFVKPVHHRQLMDVVESCRRNGARNILIIEDSEDAQELLVRAAVQAGLKPIAASDGFTGVQLARASPPAAIILDLNLPRLNGFDVLKQIRADATIRNVPVIVVTSERLDAEALRVLQAQADAVCERPQISPANVVALAKDEIKSRRGAA